MIGWNGNAEHAGFQQLIADIKTHIGDPSAQDTQTPVTTWKKPENKHFAKIFKNVWSAVAFVNLLPVSIEIVNVLFFTRSGLDEYSCNTDGDLGVTIVLIDGSYGWSDDLADGVISTIENEVVRDKDFERYDRLMVGWLGINGATTIEWSNFEPCNPGRGDQVSKATANPNLADRRFEREFLPPLTEALNTELRRPSYSNQSQLVSALEYIASLDLDRAKSDKKLHLRLVMFSPMIQHNLYGISFCESGIEGTLAGLAADLIRDEGNLFDRAEMQIEIFQFPVGFDLVTLNKLRGEWDSYLRKVTSAVPEWRTVKLGPPNDENDFQPAYDCSIVESIKLRLID